MSISTGNIDGHANKEANMSEPTLQFSPVMSIVRAERKYLEQVSCGNAL